MAEKGKAVDQQQVESKDGGLLSNLRLSRTTAIELAALGLVLAIAIILRVLPLQWGPYLNEYDPFFWYRIAEHIAKNGYASYFTWQDTLSWYPMGRDIAHSSYPGNPFSAVIIWQVLNAIQIRVSVYDVALYFPILMATLTCVAAYYFGKDLGGKAVGIFTALFMAINPSYIGRTVLGFFDTENIGIFGMVATGLFFLRSIDAKRKTPERIAYGVAGGLTMGYAFASWGAARYISSLLLLYVMVSLLLGKIEQRHIVSYSVTTVVGFLIALVIPRLGVSYILNIENLAAIGAIGLLVIYEVMKTRLQESQARLGTFALIGIALAAFIILPYLGIGNPITGKFLKVLDPFGETSPLFSSVSEHQLSTWASYWQDFGVTIILAVLGVYLLVKEGGEKPLYATLFFLTTVYFAGTLVRLTLILAFPASLLAAYALVRLIEPFKAITLKPEESRSKKRRMQAMGMSRGVGAIFILLVLASFVPQTIGASTVAGFPGPLASSGVPAIFDGKYSHDWIDALNWIKDNTTEDSIVCSWWDYGYWIETVANRTTLADGSTKNVTQIVNIARMMLEPKNESLRLMKQYNVDYVVVFVTFNPNNPKEEWPYGDNVKWPAMASIAGYNMTKFIVQDPTTGQTQYTQAFGNTTIAGLMYGVPGIETNFTLVYPSPFGWVLVYKVEY